MRLSDLQEEVTSLFKEHPLSDLPHDILELLLDWYNINSYGIQLPKLISQSNSLLAQLKQKGYIVNYDGSEDILSVTKSRDKYTSDGDDIRGRILNALYRDGIDEGMGGSSGDPDDIEENFPIPPTNDKLLQKIRDWQIRGTATGDSELFSMCHNYLMDPDKPMAGKLEVIQKIDLAMDMDSSETPTEKDVYDYIRNSGVDMPFNPRFSCSNMDMDKFDEGMGGSSGGGTAGSAGAGGSSLGLPYPSTYEEEYNKFKHFHPIDKNKRPMHNLSMTTEEQQEMFTDHDVMQLLMKDKGWPEDLQTEVLRKYSRRPQEGELFIDSVTYKGTKKLSNYGLLQNTDNMFILAGLPQVVIDLINDKWNLKIKQSKAVTMSDLEFRKWINTPGYVSQPAVVIDADVILGEGKWIASVIRGEKSKLCHVLTPGGPTVSNTKPAINLTPSKQKELAFVESQNSSSLTLNQMLPKLKKDMQNTGTGNNFHKDWLEWVNQNKVFNLKTIPIDSVSPADGLMLQQDNIDKMSKSNLSDAPVIVVHKDGTIIDGNNRHSALKKQGAQTIQAYIGESHPVLSEEDKLWARDELPQLNIKDFEDSEYTLKELRVSIDKLKPVQNERVPGLVKKTIKMLKDGKEKPIVVDKFGYIVNGHHRYDAYTKLNIKKVPVIKVNATIEELIDKYM